MTDNSRDVFPEIQPGDEGQAPWRDPTPADEMEAAARAARSARVSVQLLIEFVEREIVSPPPRWRDEDIETARRARRLTGLGLNMAGIEVALHMRNRMVELRNEIRQKERELRRVQREHDLEIGRLIRALAEREPPNPRR